MARVVAIGSGVGMTEIAQSRWARVYDRPTRDYDRTGQRVAETFEDLFATYEQKDSSMPCFDSWAITRTRPT